MNDIRSNVQVFTDAFDLFMARVDITETDSRKNWERAVAAGLIALSQREKQREHERALRKKIRLVKR